MRDTEFYSNCSYLWIPRKSSAKLALAVDNWAVTSNSFKLYTPHSRNGIFFKYLMLSLVYFAKFLLATPRRPKSKFISYFENIIGQEIISSIYYSTDKSKVVLQIQNVQDQKIIGYIKVGLNQIGNQRIVNEISANNVMINANINEDIVVLHKGLYNGHRFIMINHLERDRASISDSDVLKFLVSLQTNTKYLLSTHPRILELREKLLKLQESSFLSVLDSAVAVNNIKYRLVFEHGDFARWNIIKTSNKLVLIDLENFCKNGLEHFDALKYFYQDSKLLRKDNVAGIISYVQRKYSFGGFSQIFALMLVKEALLLKSDDQDFSLEIEIMKELMRTW